MKSQSLHETRCSGSEPAASSCWCPSTPGGSELAPEGGEGQVAGSRRRPSSECPWEKKEWETWAPLRKRPMPRGGLQKTRHTSQELDLCSEYILFKITEIPQQLLKSMTYQKKMPKLMANPVTFWFKGVKDSNTHVKSFLKRCEKVHKHFHYLALFLWIVIFMVSFYASSFLLWEGSKGTPSPLGR